MLCSAWKLRDVYFINTLITPFLNPLESPQSPFAQLFPLALNQTCSVQSASCSFTKKEIVNMGIHVYYLFSYEWTQGCSALSALVFIQERRDIHLPILYLQSWKNSPWLHAWIPPQQPVEVRGGTQQGFDKTQWWIRGDTYWGIRGDTAGIRGAVGITGKHEGVIGCMREMTVITQQGGSVTHLGWLW